MARIYNPPIGDATGFDTAQPMGALVPDSDFPDTSQVTSLHQKYVQLSTYYVAPTLGTTTLYGGVTFYLTDDRGFQDIGGGVIAWEREFARIPSQRQIWEGIDYAMPAVLSFTTFGTTFSVSAVQSNTGNNTMNLLVSTGTWTLGQLVGLQWISSAATYQQQAYEVQSVTTIGSVIALALYPNNASFTSNNATGKIISQLTASAGRKQPTNLATRAQITFDYFLPGVSAGVTVASDITVYQRLKIVTGNSVEVQYVNGNTTPSTTSWNAWVSSPIANLQDAVDSTFQLWKGQIYERKRIQFVPL